MANQRVSDGSLRLSRFRGRDAQVMRFDLPENETHRLKCLGVFEGQTIRLQKPGNPMILMAAGSRVAIADDIASRIIVEAKDDQAA